MNMEIAIVKTFYDFGHNFFKKQSFWPIFIRILAISQEKNLANLPLIVQSSGCPLEVLKQSACNFLAMTSFRAATGRCSLLAEYFCFLQFHNLTTNFLAAALSILPFCQRSVSLVSTQISEPC